MHIEINWSLKDIVKIPETEIQIHYFNLSGPKTVKKIISLSLSLFFFLSHRHYITRIIKENILLFKLTSLF